MTHPCVSQLVGLQASFCRAKVSPRHGMLGPSEECQLSLELTTHTQVSEVVRGPRDQAGPLAVCVCATGQSASDPSPGLCESRNLLHLGLGAPFLLGLLSRDTGTGSLEQAWMCPETLWHQLWPFLGHSLWWDKWAPLPNCP